MGSIDINKGNHFYVKPGHDFRLPLGAWYDAGDTVSATYGLGIIKPDATAYTALTTDDYDFEEVVINAGVSFSAYYLTIKAHQLTQKGTYYFVFASEAGEVRDFVIEVGDDAREAVPCIVPGRVNLTQVWSNTSGIGAHPSKTVLLADGETLMALRTNASKQIEVGFSTLAEPTTWSAFTVVSTAFIQTGTVLRAEIMQAEDESLVLATRAKDAVTDDPYLYFLQSSDSGATWTIEKSILLTTSDTEGKNNLGSLVETDSGFWMFRNSYNSGTKIWTLETYFGATLSAMARIDAGACVHGMANENLSAALCVIYNNAEFMHFYLDDGGDYATLCTETSANGVTWTSGETIFTTFLSSEWEIINAKAIVVDGLIKLFTRNHKNLAPRHIVFTQSVDGGWDIDDFYSPSPNGIWGCCSIFASGHDVYLSGGTSNLQPYLAKYAVVPTKPSADVPANMRDEFSAELALLPASVVAAKADLPSEPDNSSIADIKADLETATTGLIAVVNSMSSLISSLVSRIKDLWQKQGLDSANPVTLTDTSVTETTLTAGDVELTITDTDASTTTITRTPEE